MKLRRSAVFKGYTAEREAAVAEMITRLQNGERVVVGTKMAIEPGTAVARMGDVRLVVKRRATYGEFISFAPHGADTTSALLTPFYWELEIDPAMKSYLGDGVYVDTDGYYITLTTEDGISVTNTIHLDSPTFEALVRYVEGLKDLKG